MEQILQDYGAGAQTFSFGGTAVQLLLPDPVLLRRHYDARQLTGMGQAFPYWARLWPSAIALCRFMAARPEFINGRDVLELAAGLGLPGLVAAAHAAHVTLSDHMPEAVVFQAASVRLNGRSNVHCRRLDWSALPGDLSAQVLLLSDINYEPEEFPVLYQVLTDFLDKGADILLTTPQRLMARPFIGRLLPFCAHQEEIEVLHEGARTYITVMVLRAAG